MIYSDEERKFNKDITVGLIRRELLNLAEYNIHMAKLLDAGRNSMYTDIFLFITAEILYLIRFLVSYRNCDRVCCFTSPNVGE